MMAIGAARIFTSYCTLLSKATLKACTTTTITTWTLIRRKLRPADCRMAMESRLCTDPGELSLFGNLSFHAVSCLRAMAMSP